MNTSALRKLLGHAMLAACLYSDAAMANDFDGSKPLICATQEAGMLSDGEDYVKERPADLGVPVFMRVDLASKTIAGPKTTTQIRVIEKGENQLLLQGTEKGFAWTIALDQETGGLSGTLVDRSGVIALFGSCTLL